MAGNNMESLLMGDSSSGESEDEEEVTVAVLAALAPAIPPAGNDQTAHDPTRSVYQEEYRENAKHDLQERVWSQQTHSPPKHQHPALAPPQKQQLDPVQQGQTPSTAPGVTALDLGLAPLNRVMECDQQTMQQQQLQEQSQHMLPQQQYHRPTSSLIPAPPPVIQQEQQPQPPQLKLAVPMQQQCRPPQDQAAMELERRHQNGKFSLFTRVLIMYLEHKDPRLHQEAKKMILVDFENHRRQDRRGSVHFTAAMRERLKNLVGEHYWKRAEVHFSRYLQKKMAAMTGRVAPGAPSGARPSVPAGGGGAQPLSTSAAAKNPIERKPSIATPTNIPKTSFKASRPAAPPGAVSRPMFSASTTMPSVPEALPPREDRTLMKLVDHAMDFDWKLAGHLLGSKVDLQLTQEQHNLLYAELRTGTSHNMTTSSSTTNTGPRPGWGNQNVVSSRAAWALVRLREQKQQCSSTPVVGDVGLTLPPVPGAPTQTTNPPQITFDASDTAWYNEEKAEKDVTLAMLSEGVEIYLKRVLEKAIQCARQRQNLDGIRLWHQQYTSPNNKGDWNHDNDTDNTKKTTETIRPALSLRLGCDLERQQAQAAGNSAMTVKRMEQALERQSGIPARARILQGETLNDATSMADLALRPQLAKGADAADQHAKRRFEVYAGKDAMEPPLGRVPKQAKLDLIDFVMGSHLIGPVGRHRASNAATSIYF